jgi:hypothetical protein
MNCVKHFCKSESLSGENKYYCEKCKQRNESTKKLSFEKCNYVYIIIFIIVPRILVIHLKRFDNTQRKIKKFLGYGTEIDLTPFKAHATLKKNRDKYAYKLSAVLVHDGNSINSGHYYCYVRVSNNNWYCFNDHSVVKVELEKVLKQTPYLLFYEKIFEGKARNKSQVLSEKKSKKEDPKKSSELETKISSPVPRGRRSKLEDTKESKILNGGPKNKLIPPQINGRAKNKLFPSQINGGSKNKSLPPQINGAKKNVAIKHLSPSPLVSRRKAPALVSEQKNNKIFKKNNSKPKLTKNSLNETNPNKNKIPKMLQEILDNVSTRPSRGRK